jgi:hypothetical protein
MISRQAILKTKNDSEKIKQKFLRLSKRAKRAKKKTHTWKIQVNQSLLGGRSPKVSLEFTLWFV